MTDPNQPYHNEGFGLAFFWIIVVVFLFPLVAMMTVDDTCLLYTSPSPRD